MAEFELMRDIMVFHASATKNDEDPIKHVWARVLTTLSIIFRHSKAANSATIHVIWSNFDTCPRYKNNADPITKEGTRVLATLNINFSECQGQLTQQSVVGSGRISNCSEILWLSLLPASLKKI